MALEAAPTGMLMIGGGGTIVLVNAQIEKIFGYARGGAPWTTGGPSSSGEIA